MCLRLAPMYIPIRPVLVPPASTSHHQLRLCRRCGNSTQYPVPPRQALVPNTTSPTLVSGNHRPRAAATAAAVTNVVKVFALGRPFFVQPPPASLPLHHKQHWCDTTQRCRGGVIGENGNIFIPHLQRTGTGSASTTTRWDQIGRKNNAMKGEM